MAPGRFVVVLLFSAGCASAPAVREPHFDIHIPPEWTVETVIWGSGSIRAFFYSKNSRSGTLRAHSVLFLGRMASARWSHRRRSNAPRERLRKQDPAIKNLKRVKFGQIQGSKSNFSHGWSRYP